MTHDEYESKLAEALAAQKAKHDEEKKALVSEFTDSQDPLQSKSEAASASLMEAKRVFEESAGEVARNVVNIAKFGNNDSVKLAASKVVLTYALGSPNANADKTGPTPLERFLAEHGGSKKKSKAS